MDVVFLIMEDDFVVEKPDKTGSEDSRKERMGRKPCADFPETVNDRKEGEHYERGTFFGVSGQYG